MKLYLAAPWSMRFRMPAMAARFEAAGHTITATWWLAEETADVVALRQSAFRDAEAVQQAEALVLLNTQIRGRETSGKAVETGMALAWRKPVVLIGTPSNIFHALPSVVVVASVEDALHVLAGTESDRRFG